jgi:uncharacterized protein YkwD
MRLPPPVVARSFAGIAHGIPAHRAVARRLVLIFLLMMAGAIHPPFHMLAAGDPNADQDISSGATLRPAAATSVDLPFAKYDSEAERLLLQFVNQARLKVGVPALKLDPGLCRAALAHAFSMLSAHMLSHQFEGEPSLTQRLAAATHIQLVQEAENVALDYTPQDGHQRLMKSPPHRANLLNPAYNVVGIGVVHAGESIFIVQDFARALPAYSVAEFKDKVATAVTLARRQTSRPNLARLDSVSKNLPGLDSAACSMAQAEQIVTPSIHKLGQQYTVVTYTTLHPDILPEDAHRALQSYNLRSFSMGGCYAKTEMYPAGAYWVVLALK